jgi:hypothetical protein
MVEMAGFVTLVGLIALGIFGGVALSCMVVGIFCLINHKSVSAEGGK